MVHGATLLCYNTNIAYSMIIDKHILLSFYSILTPLGGVHIWCMTYPLTWLIEEELWDFFGYREMNLGRHPTHKQRIPPEEHGGLMAKRVEWINGLIFWSCVTWENSIYIPEDSWKEGTIEYTSANQ